MEQHHQNKGGFGTARPVSYSPPIDIKEPAEVVITEEDDDMPQSLEEALTG